MPQCKRLISGSDQGALGKKLSLTLEIIVLICVFSYMGLYCCCDICFHNSQTAAKQVPPMLVKSLTACSGPDAEEGSCEIVRSGHEVWNVWGRS